MDAPLWVFGYGSLMWNPGFPHRRSVKARLSGAHRSLCVYSWVHRGTEKQPGLVFGLDRGGACVGMAFESLHADADGRGAYLREREQVTSVYLKVAARSCSETGERTEALAYVVDRNHPQYAGRLPHEAMVEIVRTPSGAPAAIPTTSAPRRAPSRPRIRDRGVEALCRRTRARISAAAARP